jgi:hypothetical protein
MVVWWLIGMGCNRAQGEAEKVVTELCRWGQLDDLTPAGLPKEVDLPALVREVDLRYASDERGGKPSADNPFLALSQTLGMVIEEPVLAMSEALAERSECLVEITPEGERLKAHVVRKVNVPQWDRDEVHRRLREVEQVADHEGKVALLSKWLAEIPARESTDDLLVEKHGERWVANLELPESAIAEAESKLAVLDQQIATGETAQAELSKLTVLGTRYQQRSSKRSSIPRLEIMVHNGTELTIGRIDFYGTLTSADRETPWVQGELPVKVRGKFMPGADETFTVVSLLPNQWRTRAPDGSVANLTPIRAADTKGNVVWTVDGLEDAKADAAILRETIATLRSTYGIPAS